MIASAPIRRIGPLRRVSGPKCAMAGESSSRPPGASIAGCGRTSVRGPPTLTLRSLRLAKKVLPFRGQSSAISAAAVATKVSTDGIWMCTSMWTPNTSKQPSSSAEISPRDDRPCSSRWFSSLSDCASRSSRLTSSPATCSADLPMSKPESRATMSRIRCGRRFKTSSKRGCRTVAFRFEVSATRGATSLSARKRSIKPSTAGASEAPGLTCRRRASLVQYLSRVLTLTSRASALSESVISSGVR
jgi:hypothetical protein